MSYHNYRNNFSGENDVQWADHQKTLIEQKKKEIQMFSQKNQEEVPG